MSSIMQFNYKQHWQERDIILERPTSEDTSLGFTIAGGIDIPFVHPRFTSIIVINISKNSIAHTDEGLKLYDIILRVNNIDFTNIKHHEAINVLKTSGPTVRLLIRRLSPSICENIEIEHNGKLGISITGGIGSEHFQNDHGIFITNIKKPQANQNLHKGDRLLEISSERNTYDLRFVTHQMAKKYIKSACKESKKIKLHVGRARLIDGMYRNRDNLSADHLLNGRSAERSQVFPEVRPEQPHVNSRDYVSGNRLLNGRNAECSQVFPKVTQEQANINK
ncbi:unnamed protein product [Rotaria sp. Silwood1]|nr:unnamed protein product [Rotaria sp. Silwood1]